MTDPHDNRSKISSNTQKGGIFYPYPNINDKDFYKKIYRKKEFYDTKPPRHPDPGDQSKETLEKIFSKDGDFKLLPHQRFLRNFISEATPYNSVFIWHSTGTGKCLAEGTKILMYNGDIKEVQNINIGDILMNDRSEGNIVVSLASGEDDMYEISSKIGDSYIVNSEHILCLKRDAPSISYVNGEKRKRWRVFYIDKKTFMRKFEYYRTRYEAEYRKRYIIKNDDDILEIEVKDYLKLPNCVSKHLKGFRTGIEFDKKNILYDPYSVGVIYGSKNSISNDIINLSINPKLVKINLLYQNNNIYRLSSKDSLLLSGNIPLCYKANTRDVRLNVLAGIIDSVGRYNKDNHFYEIITEKRSLIDDTLFIARSLGVTAYYEDNTVVIYGKALDNLPVKIKDSRRTKTKSDNLVTDINVRYVGKGRYYGFVLTGNRRFLINDFVVTHNTCSSIAIAERFHNRVESTGKKILMVVGPNIKGEFFKTIFNFEKEAAKKSSRQVVQCTGRTYQLGVEAKYQSEKTRERKITKMIKDVYEIVGIDKLRNRIIRETGWNGKISTLNEHVTGKLRDMFSDRVIVIDEVHNRVSTEGADKSIPTIFLAIIGAAENIKLVLMSATPMINSPDDIIFPINLMRINDGFDPVKKRDIFTSEGNFKDGGVNILKKISQGYFSYVRGGDPPRFPYEIVPAEAKTPSPIYTIEGPKIPKNKMMRTTKVIECKLSDYQYRTYLASIRKDRKSRLGGLLTGSSQAGNIVFPLPTGKYGVYGSSGIGDKQSEDHPILKFKDAKDNEIYKYATYSEGFLLDKYIGKYSVKFKQIFDRVTNSIGVNFVYSQFLSAGVTSLALMLEENGYIPAIITGKEHVLLQSKTKKPPICYMCGKTKHSKTDHVWSPAKYVLLTGSQQLNPDTDIPKISGYINREENMYGKLVKVLLGSEVSGEGIDFKRIRQVHILEPWYNQARIDQVKGRAIRNGSHRDLPPEQRNVEVFKYCVVPPSRRSKEEKIETVDERDYRYAEDKDRKIKAAEYILKQMAIDCMFQRENNLRLVRRVVKLESSRGKIINFVTGDRSCSRECDYKKSCSYNCFWTPEKKVVIDRSTYGPEFAQADVEKARTRVQELFKEHYVIDVRRIFEYIRKTDSDVDPIYIYLAIESLMNPDGEYAVQDLYGREGYLVERDDLFIFQPFDIADEFAPMWYRKTPLMTKVKNSPFPVSEIAKASEQAQQGKLPKKSGEQILNDRWNIYKKIILAVKQYIKNEKAYKDYKNIFMDMTVSFLPDRWAISMLKYLLSDNKVLKSSKDKERNEFNKDIVRYYLKIGSIFNEKSKKKGRKAIMVGDQCTQWGRADFGVKKRLRKDWGKCDPDIESHLESVISKIIYESMWRKIPTSMKIRQGEDITRSEYIFLAKQSNILPDYVGTIEQISPNYTKAFKVLDFTREEEIKRKDKGRSKRSEIRGRVCSTFKVPYIQKTLVIIEKEAKKANIKNLNIQETSKGKKSRLNMCVRLEFLLRVLNEFTNKLWFFQGRFMTE